MRKFFVTIPHGSSRVPESLVSRINPKANIREICEQGLFELCEWEGVPRIYFDLHECVVNANRSRDDIDPKTNLPYPPQRSVFSQKDFRGVNMFLSGKGLSEEEKAWYLKNFYDKFFGEIERNIMSQKFDFFVDVHLMNSRNSGYERGLPVTDICIGNLGGVDGEVAMGRINTTFSAEGVRILKEKFESKGYNCALNRPFAGGYIVFKYLGKFPCFQLEINKRVYMTADDGEVVTKKLEKLSLDLFQILGQIDMELYK